MTQSDMILRIPKCSALEISRCEDPLSHKVIMHGTDEGLVVTDQLICSVAVPGACPRIQCMKVGEGYRPCRMLGVIESQENEDGFWMRLPCSSCVETTRLHPLTRGFVHD